MNKKLLTAVLAGLVCLMPAIGDTRDTHHMFPIQAAMNANNAQERLGDDVKFYFGDAEHPPVAKEFGEYMTNKKTNAFGKSDLEACNWVFLSAMLELQERAQQLGADAVVNIRSYYKENEISSKTEFECGAGFALAGVALKGDFVRFK